MIAAGNFILADLYLYSLNSRFIPLIMMKRFLSGCLLITLFSSTAFADEGMWLLMYLKKMNEGDMQAKGMKITADDIYNVNHSSIKDAVVQMGGFCTGEIISKEGLMLTNHHCGYDAVATHSTVEHDYLTNGFWAYDKKQELPCPELFVKFLVRMEDVTQKVLAAGEGKTDAEKEAAYAAAIKELKKTAVEGTGYDAEIKPFFEGNEYYLFVYETYNDVRLVGAPPSSIGKFGGETDNWMWPRHTGDFSMFRIYMSPEGKPASYSPDNIPLKPKYHLPLSIKGVKKEDYAMILGYPGSTERFLTSYGVQMLIEKERPEAIALREKRLDIMKEDMRKSDEIRIKYASQFAQVSNYYKNFIGEVRGLKRLHVYDRKKEEENKFEAWVNASPERKEKYGSVISDLSSGYADLNKNVILRTYIGECVFGIESAPLYTKFFPIYFTYEADKTITPDKLLPYIEKIRPDINEYFNTHNAPTDKKILAAMLDSYYKDVPAEFHPEKLTAIHKKYKGDFMKFAEALYAKSVLLDKAKMEKYLAAPDKKTLEKDEGFMLVLDFYKAYQGKVVPLLSPAEDKIEHAMKLYVDGLRKMNPDKKYYPDANFTMRLTYGNVLDYSGADAVNYNYYTTIEGIMEKEDPSNPEFVVPAKLKELYQKKDYGQYAENGVMHVCFLSNNDITGGNSGSPVINGNGELIGTAFDGNWEAMSGDIAFEPTLQRTISVDIRYTLFIIEKFAGAKNLIDEMTIVK